PRVALAGVPALLHPWLQSRAPPGRDCPRLLLPPRPFHASTLRHHDPSNIDLRRTCPGARWLAPSGGSGSDAFWNLQLLLPSALEGRRRETRRREVHGRDQLLSLLPRARRRWGADVAPQQG